MKDFFKKFHRPIALKTSQTENTLFGCADDSLLQALLNSSTSVDKADFTHSSCLQ